MESKFVNLRPVACRYISSHLNIDILEIDKSEVAHVFSSVQFGHCSHSYRDGQNLNLNSLADVPQKPLDRSPKSEKRCLSLFNEFRVIA